MTKVEKGYSWELGKGLFPSISHFFFLLLVLIYFPVEISVNMHRCWTIQFLI